MITYKLWQVGHQPGAWVGPREDWNRNWVQLTVSARRSRLTYYGLEIIRVTSDVRGTFSRLYEQNKPRNHSLFSTAWTMRKFWERWLTSGSPFVLSLPVVALFYLFITVAAGYEPSPLPPIVQYSDRTNSRSTIRHKFVKGVSERKQAKRRIKRIVGGLVDRGDADGVVEDMMRSLEKGSSMLRRRCRTEPASMAV